MEIRVNGKKAYMKVYFSAVATLIANGRSPIYLKIIIEFQSMFFKLNCKVLTSTKNNNKQQITPISDCDLYVFKLENHL